MLCTYCKTTRVENDNPCPNCGAPSPRQQRAHNGGWATSTPTGPSAAWDQPSAQASNAPRNAAPNSAWYSMDAGYQDTSEAQVPQLSFDAAPLSQPPVQASPAWPQRPAQAAYGGQPFQQISPSGQRFGAPGYSDQAFPQTPQVANQAGQNMLPVPYQGHMPADQDGRQSTMSLQIVPDNFVEHLLPAQPAASDVVYVTPMYTKPRPIIPKYRAISGLLSVLVVALLLCSGVVYYAKASGTLDALNKFYNGARPQNLTVKPGPQLPDPPAQTDKDKGPAYNIIPSATTASRIDEKNHIAIVQDTKFKPGQTIYLTFGVLVPAQGEGIINTKWYMNGHYLESVPSDKKVKFADSPAYNGSIAISTYQTPAEGMVELYWNDQLAQKLYFVVR